MSDTDLLKKELLRPDEAAAIFRVTKQTIYHWIDMGIIEHKKIGGVTRITTTSVKAVIKSTMQP